MELEHEWPHGIEENGTFIGIAIDLTSKNHELAYAVAYFHPPGGSTPRHEIKLWPPLYGSNGLLLLFGRTEIW